MPAASDAREIATLVPMASLLGSLGFIVNERTRRAPCLLHAGHNYSAFSWTEGGLWRCHSCGRGGDRIALVRAAKGYSFRDAVMYLAALAGVKFCAPRLSRQEISRRLMLRQRAEHAAWGIADQIGRLRCYYLDGLHRAERLQVHIGDELLGASTDIASEAVWERLSRLGVACTFFFAAWNFILDATPDLLVHFALASPGARRRFILEGEIV
jgi:hypothetical protein